MAYEMKYVGHTGPAGYKIIAASEASEFGEYGVMLAMLETSHGTMWATWEFNANIEDEPNCYWGHYFDNSVDALKNYLERVANLHGVYKN